MSALCVFAPQELAEELAHRRGDEEIRSDEAGQSHLLEVPAGGAFGVLKKVSSVCGRSETGG